MVTIEELIDYLDYLQSCCGVKTIDADGAYEAVEELLSEKEANEE